MGLKPTFSFSSIKMIQIPSFTFNVGVPVDIIVVIHVSEAITMVLQKENMHIWVFSLKITRI